VSRRDTLLEISASFEDDFTVSLEPDLPELFEGPDVLAGKSGRLIAVFVPKSHELRNPERLLTRLVLSRLALPDHAQCLLAIEEAQDSSRVERIARDFHAVVSVDDRAGLRRLRTKSQEHRHVPASTRQMVERRTAFLMTLSLAHQPQLAAAPDEVGEDWESVDIRPTTSSSNGTSGAAHVPLPLWPMPLLTQSALLQAGSASVSVYDGVLVAGGVAARRGIHERILPYLTVAAQAAFRVDNGVPYLGHPTAGVFIVQDARWPRSDPLKPLRASAFAGWALLSNPSKEEFSESVREASEWLVGTVSELA
jgi:hypothetical protein